MVSLLELPLEIRRLIYDSLIEQRHKVTILKNCYTFDRKMGQSIMKSLSNTCRQTREEIKTWVVIYPHILNDPKLGLINTEMTDLVIRRVLRDMKRSEYLATDKAPKAWRIFCKYPARYGNEIEEEFQRPEQRKLLTDRSAIAETK